MEAKLPEDCFLPLKELSRISGRSVRTHRKQITEEGLPFYQPGRKILVLWSEYCQWMRRFRGGNQDEIEIQRIIEKIKG